MNATRILRRLLVLAAAVAALVTQASAVEYTKDSLETVRKNLAQGKAVLLDVRELGEWKQGHLADATLLPLSELRKMAKEEELRDKIVKDLPRDKIIYCHCGSGVRVINATQLLEKEGVKIQPLEAGYKDLLEAGFPRGSQP